MLSAIYIRCVDFSTSIIEKDFLFAARCNSYILNLGLF